MRISNSDTTTNVNTTSLTEIPLDVETGPATGFTRVGNAIRTDFDGYVDLSAAVHMQSTSQRPAVALEYFSDSGSGAVSLGPRYNSSYIRSGSGHNEASSQATSFIVPCVDGELFSLRGIREGNLGTVTMSAAGRAYLQARRA
jgi:hypothetical protein